MTKPAPRIVPFTLDHLDVMEIRHFEKTDIDEAPDRYLALANASVAGTVFYDGRIIAVIGFAELSPGCNEVWVIPSIYVPQYSRIFLRTIRNYLKQIEETTDVQRFQCPQFISPELDHWMRHLGFQEEGIMRKYWKGQDLKMWGRTL